MLTARIDEKQLTEAVSKLKDALDVQEMLDDATTILLNRIRTRFLAETAPDGTKWEPSKAGLRRRSKGGTGTLFDTGNLFHSIQAHAVGKDGRAIGTDVEYAKKHQEGLDGQVKRVFLGFSDEDVNIVLNMIRKRLEGI